MLQEAYHGTSLENAHKICNSCNKINFNISCSESEWLGHGIYFFDNLNDAMDWSKKVKHFTNVAVISVLIKADEEKVLNLISNKEHIDLFNKAYSSIKKRSKNFADKGINVNYAAMAIAIINKQFAYDVIRAIFKVDKKLKNSIKNIHTSMLIGRIQICVINSKCISNCKIITEE